MGDMTAKHESGLQLLQMEVYCTKKKFALPKSLRFLFLKQTWDQVPQNLLYRWLGSLCNLEELYMMGFCKDHFQMGRQ